MPKVKDKPQPKSKSKSKSKAGPPKRRRGWRTAADSDVHELYELSVQDAEAEVDLIDQVWRERRGRHCRSLREDFCGTANVSMQWVKHRRENTAVGVDIDPDVLAWARQRIAERLPEKKAERLALVQADVTAVELEPVECLIASNFSYFLFKTRQELLRYLKHARRGIAKGGLMMLDAYGGSDSFLEMEEERDLDGFTYVWDQDYYNPITGQVINHIHFRFPDGTEINKAFTYDWRLWTLPEIQELLLEAGFSNVCVYWEGTDEDTGEGNGEWTLSTEGEACEGWIAYLCAENDND